MLTFRPRIGVLLEEFFWYICVYTALCWSWIPLAPSGLWYFTNIYLIHKHAELRIISKMKNVEKEPPQACADPRQLIIIIPSHQTHSFWKCNQFLNWKEFQNPVFAYQQALRGQKSQFAHNSCSGSNFSLWMSLLTSDLGILAVT